MTQEIPGSLNLCVRNLDLRLDMIFDMSQFPSAPLPTSALRKIPDSSSSSWSLSAASAQSLLRIQEDAFRMGLLGLLMVKPLGSHALLALLNTWMTPPHCVSLELFHSHPVVPHVFSLERLSLSQCLVYFCFYVSMPSECLKNLIF